MLGLVIALAAAPMVSADAFIGAWTCERSASGFSYTWDVSKETLKGRWLFGVAKMNDEIVALDIWSYTEDGRPDIRRQFNHSNAMIEMWADSIVGSTIGMEGRIDPNGENLAMEMIVSFVSKDELHARSRFRDEAGNWQSDLDETCRR